MIRFSQLRTLLLLAFMIGTLSGCGVVASETPTLAPLPATAAPTLAPLLPSATAILPSPTVTRTNTPLSPTATNALPYETATTQPTLTMTPTVIPVNGTAKPTGVSSGRVGGSGGLKVFLVALKTGGTVGCNDSVVPFSTGIPSTREVAADIETALNTLFGMKSKYYGNLYNPVSYSTLRVQKIDWSASTGGLEVWLSGKYRPSGDDCDNTRVKAQIWATAKQFGGIQYTNFYINGPHPFGDFVSNDK